MGRSKKYTGQFCKTGGCQNKAATKDVCLPCYHKSRYVPKPKKAPVLCKTEDCENSSLAKGLCKNCYAKAYYKANPDACKAATKSWAARNPELVKQRSLRLSEFRKTEEGRQRELAANRARRERDPKKARTKSKSLVEDNKLIAHGHQASWVYVFQVGDIERVKIGFSTNLPSRLSHLKSGAPDLVRLLAIWPGGAEEERRVHSKFRTSRFRNEIFNLTDALVEEIEKLSKPHLEEVSLFNSLWCDG